jgi:hypothetical protein
MLVLSRRTNEFYMFSAKRDGSLFVRKYDGDRSAFGIRVVEMPNVL